MMARTVGIMQPYIFPYIGYFQLIAATQCFVVYDDVKYTKKGWINRNRFLLHGSPAYFSVPLRSDSDALDVRQRFLAENFMPHKILNQLTEAYRRAPFFDETFDLVEKVFLWPQRNLFDFLFFSIQACCDHLGLRVPLLVSSSLNIDRQLKAQERVIASCLALRATNYLNPIGGQALYVREDFARHGLVLEFLQAGLRPYRQVGEGFVPALSILDVLFFNGLEKTRQQVFEDFKIISN